jgi:hypothetical protein
MKNGSPQDHNVSPKQKAIEDFESHVSFGKLAVFRKYGIDLAGGRRRGPYLWDLDGRKAGIVVSYQRSCRYN